MAESLVKKMAVLVAGYEENSCSIQGLALSLNVELT